MCSAHAPVQSKIEMVKIYVSGDNSNDQIKIIEGDYGIISVHFLRKNDPHWMETEILSIDTIQEYLKVRIKDTKEVFELFVEWNSDKMTSLDSHKRKVIYWLK